MTQVKNTITVALCIFAISNLTFASDNISEMCENSFEYVDINYAERAAALIECANNAREYEYSCPEHIVDGTPRDIEQEQIFKTCVEYISNNDIDKLDSKPPQYWIDKMTSIIEKRQAMVNSLRKIRINQEGALTIFRLRSARGL